jgi:nucleoid-associated protein YgaU
MVTNKRSRQRLVFVAVAAGLLVGLARPALLAAAPHPLPAPVVHVVRPGETLWGLAERYAPREDPRQYIYELGRINSLGNGAIFPGERLTLPN